MHQRPRKSADRRQAFDTTVRMHVHRHTFKSLGKSSMVRVSYGRANLCNCTHLLRTDHVSPNKLVDIVEVPGFRDSAVVIAVW